MKKSQVIVFILIVITGCARKPVNLSIAKDKIQDYYECGAHEREVGVVVEKAKRYFKAHVPRKHDVIIFDIDDTLLSDYCETKKISFGFVPELNHEWILEAKARAVPHIKSLYDLCLSKGYLIIIISGRKEDERAATIKNLHERGFDNFAQLILRDPDEEDLTALAYKSARRAELIRQGYHIVGSIGDQWSDLCGGNAGHQVKIPNYMYILE